MTIPTPTPHDAMTAEEFERLARVLEYSYDGIAGGESERASAARTNAVNGLRAAAAQARELAIWRKEAALAMSDGAHPHAKSVAAKMQERVAMQSLLADGEK